MGNATIADAYSFTKTARLLADTRGECARGSQCAAESADADVRGGSADAIEGAQWGELGSCMNV